MATVACVSSAIITNLIYKTIPHIGLDWIGVGELVIGILSTAAFFMAAIVAISMKPEDGVKE